MKNKIIAIEEHFITKRHLEELKRLELLKYNPMENKSDNQKKIMDEFNRKLLDLDDVRLMDMDRVGLDIQVLQFSGHGLDRMDSKVASAIAKESNDILGELIKKYPSRFSGFAQLNMQNPKEAAIELERCVNKLNLKGVVISGKCNGHYLDHESFTPVLAGCEKLNVPIYLHPGEPSQELFEELYSDLPNGIGGPLSISGWGWHMENCLHSLRLVLAGVFDKFPNLKIIIGHMGEGIPFYLDRADKKMAYGISHLKKGIKEYFLSNFYITTSGFFSNETLNCALEVFGADRIIFAIDYPYSTNKEGIEFLNSANLSEEDFEKISHKNVEKLLNL
ncbi:MAG: amidohydrolase family protein [Clostridium perfringens]|nr:amidohydrolase family protein [Clostridium perfringens]